MIRSEALSIARPLLGRATHLDHLTEALHRALGMRSTLALVRGPAGIGKTCLLDHFLAGEDCRVVTVLRATADEVSTYDAYGVVRDLLRGPDLPGVTGSSGMVGAAARQALPVLAPDTGHRSPTAGSNRFAVMQGLYRLVVDLAAERPLVLVIDNVHWCDEPSLQWLDFLLRRAERLPLLVILAARGEHDGSGRSALGDLLAGNPHRVMDLEPLDESAIRAVVADTFDVTPADSFLTTCRVLTGGNPALLHRLIAVVHREPIAADVTGVDWLTELRPPVVVDALNRLLASLPEHVRAVAVAVAVLGAAGIENLAAWSGISPQLAAEALADLRRCGLLTAGRDEFQHALLRSALLDGLTAAERDRARAAAARLLNDAGRPAEEVAGHLMLLSSLDEAWMPSVLREASAAAVRRGAPETAAEYLERVVAATPDDAEVRGALARVLAHVDPATAMAHLRLLLDRTDDPRARVGLAVPYGLLSLTVHQAPQAFHLLGSVLDGLNAVIGETPSASDHELRMETEFGLLVTGLDEMRTVAAAIRRARTITEPRGDTPMERQVLDMLAMAYAMAGRDAAAVVSRARCALHVDGSTESWWTMVSSAVALYLADEVDEALAALDSLMARSRRDGAPWTISMILTVRAFVLEGAGEILRAEADARAAYDIASQAAWGVPTAQPFAVLAQVLVHKDEPERAEAILAAIDRPRLGDFAWESHLVLMARATARRRLGDLEGALRILRSCGASLESADLINPVFVPWWVEAAQVLADLGRPGEAVPLAERGAAMAKDWGTARAHGLSLFAAGVSTGGHRGVELLEGAVHRLGQSPAKGDCIRAKVALGRALLDLGDSRGARAHLRDAVVAAVGSGARSLAADARSLLISASGRMREVPTSTLDALSGSERRVVHMAASGQSNRAIAEELFVTLRTVEAHLTSAYRKLGVNGRADLTALVERDSRVSFDARVQ